MEAKRTGRSPEDGTRQAEDYADALLAATGQDPVIYRSNGSEHRVRARATDATHRRVHGFATRVELERRVQRRRRRKPLASVPVDRAIAGRPYQERAIRAVAEHFEEDRQRRALLVMATGTGKTRTAIALTDLLTRASWARTVLFLADRTALVKQAERAFKAHLPNTTVVNLLEERTTDGRVFVATYPTMLGLDEFAAQDARRELASLPSAETDPDELAKRFDLLCLQLQLALLTGEDAAVGKIRGTIQQLASALLAQTGIAAVKQQAELLESAATDTWWDSAGAPGVERIRRRLGGLLRYLPRGRVHVVYSDFADEIGEIREVETTGSGVGTDPERFTAKAREYLRSQRCSTRRSPTAATPPGTSTTRPWCG